MMANPETVASALPVLAKVTDLAGGSGCPWTVEKISRGVARASSPSSAVLTDSAGSGCWRTGPLPTTATLLVALTPAAMVAVNGLSTRSR